MAPITDQEWDDLVAHELPQQSDPVVQKYLESRSALMVQEQKQRSDSSFRQALSPIARKACDIVDRIRHEERAAALASTPVLELLDFSKDSRETTKSWQIIRRLPKGALLGAHCHAMVDIGHLLQVALSTPGMHISCPGGHLATAEDRRLADLCIRFRAKGDAEGRSLWTDSYKPGAFAPLGEAADNYPEGGRSGFVEWLKGRCTPTSSKTANIIDELVYYEPIWRAFLQRLMSTLAEDGISWLELRLVFPLAYYQEGSETPDPDYDHMFQVIEEEVVKFQASDPGQPFWGLRLIWSAKRDQNARSIIEDADNCISTKIVWPHLVGGYDLAGPEDLGRPLADLLPELFWLRKQCVVEGVQVPFFFSAGESLDYADATEGNLFDALLLGTRRIGGAASLYQHPRLVEAVRDKRILVEAHPTAGRILHHPLPALLAQGVSCALCDDITGARTGLDSDVRMTSVFWQVFGAWDSIDLAGLGSLAENSVRWAAFEDQDAETWARDIRTASTGAGVKAARLQQWAVQWERFCLWVVTEYGEAYGDGVDDDTKAAE